MARKRSGRWLGSVAGTVLRSRHSPKAAKSVAGRILVKRKSGRKRKK